jgi:hypothetical protein
MNARALLVVVLRIGAAVESLAFVGAFLPRSWMEAGYHYVGPGDMPPGPVFESVMRQVSFTYGLHALGLWLISSDVLRYRPFVILTGFCYLIAGPAFLAFDLHIGMPAFWVLGNGGGALVNGAVILLLVWLDNRQAAIDTRTSVGPSAQSEAH